MNDGEKTKSSLVSKFSKVDKDSTISTIEEVRRKRVEASGTI